MTRHSLCTAALVCLLGVPAWAQTATPAAPQPDATHAPAEHAETIPLVEVFGGYSVSREEGEMFNGWAATLQVNLSRWLAIEGETSGHYKSLHGIDFSKNSFLVGPRLSMRGNKVVPFVYALAGVERIKGGVEVAHVVVSESESETAFALGGGFDIELSHRWALAIEGDGLMVRAHESTHWTPRFSAGLVLHLGER